MHPEFSVFPAALPARSHEEANPTPGPADGSCIRVNKHCRGCEQSAAARARRRVEGSRFAWPQWKFGHASGLRRGRRPSGAYPGHGLAAPSEGSHARFASPMGTIWRRSVRVRPDDRRHRSPPEGWAGPATGRPPTTAPRLLMPLSGAHHRSGDFSARIEHTQSARKNPRLVGRATGPVDRRNRRGGIRLP